MSDAQGPASTLWQSVKQSLNIGKSQDSDHDLRRGSVRSSGSHDLKRGSHLDSSSPAVLSASDIHSLPPLQNGSAHHSEVPHKEHLRTSSWIKRFGSRKRSSDFSASAPEDPVARPDATAGQVGPQKASSEAAARLSHDVSRGSSRRTSAEQQKTEQQASKKAASGSREAFLEEYDAATLELCNRLSGSTASCIGDTGFQDVAPWNRESGYLGHLNSQQQQALQQLKAAFPSSSQWHTDHDLLRFLRARDFDVRKSKEMYQKYIEEYRGKFMVSPNPPIRPTRGPFDVDLVKLFPERDAALTQKLEKLMEWFLHTIAFGTDKDGRPVVFFRPGDILNQKMTKYVPVPDRIAFQSTSNEMLAILTKMASHNAGFHIDSIIQVLDLGGMSAMQMVSHMRSPDAQKEWQHNLDFHPEVLHKIYIIGAPSGMPLIWKVASPFLPAATKRKVEVLGSDYKKVLVKAIGSDNLPSCYGGKTHFEWPTHRHIKELKY